MRLDADIFFTVSLMQRSADGLAGLSADQITRKYTHKSYYADRTAAFPMQMLLTISNTDFTYDSNENFNANKYKVIVLDRISGACHQNVATFFQRLKKNP